MAELLLPGVMCLGDPLDKEAEGGKREGQGSGEVKLKRLLIEQMFFGELKSSKEQL